MKYKMRGDQKYLIFWSPKRAHTVGRERKRRKEEEEEEKEEEEAKKRYGSLEFGMDSCMEFVRILGFI